MALQTSVKDKFTRAFPGMAGDSSMKVDDSYVNEESSDELAFGRMVKRGTGEQGALRPTSASDVLAGIVVHTHSYDPRLDLGDVGVKPTKSVLVRQKGRIWVELVDVATAGEVSIGDPVHVRVVAASGQPAGAFRVSADSTNTIDCSAFARWLTAGNRDFALLEIDMANVAADAA